MHASGNDDTVSCLPRSTYCPISCSPPVASLGYLLPNSTRSSPISFSLPRPKTNRHHHSKVRELNYHVNLDSLNMKRAKSLEQMLQDSSESSASTGATTTTSSGGGAGPNVWVRGGGAMAGGGRNPASRTNSVNRQRHHQVSKTDKPCYERVSDLC